MSAAHPALPRVDAEPDGCSTRWSAVLDASSDRSVTIHELIRAVNAALNGCGTGGG